MMKKIRVMIGYLIGSIITFLGALFMMMVSITYQLICMIILLTGMSIISVVQEYDRT